MKNFLLAVLFVSGCWSAAALSLPGGDWLGTGDFTDDAECFDVDYEKSIERLPDSEKTQARELYSRILELERAFEESHAGGNPDQLIEAYDALDHMFEEHKVEYIEESLDDCGVPFKDLSLRSPSGLVFFTDS